MNTEPELSHEQRFWELYKAAFQGLHAQFERPWGEFDAALFDGGAEELQRSKAIARRAWSSAVYATAMFEDNDAVIRQFNRTVRAISKKEEKESQAELDHCEEDTVI